MSTYMKDDSSIDILEFFDSDDDSLFHPRQKRRKKKPKSKQNVSPKKGKESAMVQKKKKPKRKRKPKPADMPRRPLSAYNIYFREQRALIIGTKPPNLEDLGSSNGDSGPAKDGLPPNFQRKKRAHRKTHGKISFSNLAKEIGKSWNDLPQDQRTPYVAGATKEKERYQKELRIYRLRKKEQEQEKQQKGEENTEVGETSKNQDGERLSLPSYRTREKFKQEERRYEMGGEKIYHPRGTSLNDQTIDYSHGTYGAIVSPSSNCEDRMGDSSYSSHDHEYAYHIKSRYDSCDHNSPRTPRREERATPHYVLDSINPLPLTYDARHHKDDHVNENDMIKFVSPLLRRKSNRAHRKRLPTSSYYKSGHDDRYINNNRIVEDSKVSSNTVTQQQGHHYNKYHYSSRTGTSTRNHHHNHTHVMGTECEPDMSDFFNTSTTEIERVKGEYRQDHEYSDIASGVFSL